jgi:hypothetical protein
VSAEREAFLPPEERVNESTCGFRLQAEDRLSAAILASFRLKAEATGLILSQALNADAAALIVRPGLIVHSRSIRRVVRGDERLRLHKRSQAGGSSTHTRASVRALALRGSSWLREMTE